MYRDDRVGVAQERPERLKQRRQLVQDVVERRKTALGSGDRRSEALEQLTQLGRELVGEPEALSQLRRDRVKRAHDGVGPVSERCQSRQRQPALELEFGQCLEHVGEVLVAPRGRREQAVGGRDQARELPAAGADRVEELARVRDQAADRCRLRVERREQVLTRVHEVRQRSERRVDVGAASHHSTRLVLHPDLERLARGGVKRRQDLVERDIGLDLPIGEPSAVRQIWPAAVAAAELDVGLAEQRLDPQSRPCVGGDRRIPSLDLERRERAAVLAVDLQSDNGPDVDAGDPDVRATGELVGLGERDLDPVTLGGERDRSTEADPQIGQYEHAREHEPDQPGEPKRAGRRLDHFGTAWSPFILQELEKFGRSNCSSSVSRVGFCFGF